MTSRLSIVAILTLGLLLSTAGVGLAISGPTVNHSNASVAQYGTPTPTPTPEGGVLGGTGTSGKPGTPDTSVTPTGNGGGLQPAKQVEAGASGTQLPFTGFLAIPVLLIGVTLLGAGVVLRYRSTREDR
jgi:hypothetical protein